MAGHPAHGIFVFCSPPTSSSPHCPPPSSGAATPAQGGSKAAPRREGEAKDAFAPKESLAECRQFLKAAARDPTPLLKVLLSPAPQRSRPARWRQRAGVGARLPCAAAGLPRSMREARARCTRAVAARSGGWGGDGRAQHSDSAARTSGVR